MLLAGGFLALRGRRAPGQWIRTEWLVPPVAIGAVVVPGAVAVAAGLDSSTVLGAAALGAAAVYGLVAVQLRAGTVTVASYALATVGLGALAPWKPLDRPWTLVPWVAALVAVSLVASKLSAERDPWRRWDVAPLVVAHGVAAVALARSADVGWVPATWAGIGAVSIAVAAWRRRPDWEVGGTGLILVGAAVAGHGWGALALAATSARATQVAIRAPGSVRIGLQMLGVAAAGAAWAELAMWEAWPAGPTVFLTAAAAGGLGLVVGLLARYARLPRDWAAAWGGLAAAGVVAAAAAAPQAPDRPAGFGLALGTAGIAAGAGLAARPLRVPRLRDLAAALVLGAGWALWHALQPPARTGVAAAVAAGLAATAVSLALWRFRPRSPWLAPLALAAAGSGASSLVLAAAAFPRRDLLAVALLATAVETTAVGITMRRAGPLYLSLALLFGAWALFAADALSGDPGWYTVPAGIAVLGEVELARWSRRTSGRRAGTMELALIELAGIALLVGSPLVKTVTAGEAYGALVAGLGACVAGWGALTQVRRRVAAGAAAVVASVVLVLAVPLVGLAPRLRGVGVWAALAALGTIMIALASVAERNRARLRRVAGRLGDLMHNWE